MNTPYPTDPDPVAAEEGRHGAIELGRHRRWRFAATCLLFGVISCLAFAQAGLRWQARRIERSNQLDPGMIQYDRALGWRLVPEWTGTHRHYDYTARYHINRRGLRGPAKSDADRGETTIAVLGDSFTFGFGVEDDETFVSRIGEQMGPDVRVRNFGVPGYSTDQEALLLERRVLHFRPTLVVIVVYLGNDLVDNRRGFPMQAPRAKPFFTLGQNGLELANTPVPQEARPVRNAQVDLARAILGESGTVDAGGTPQEMPFTVWQRAAAAVGREPNYTEQISDNQQASLDLFWALAGRMASACAKQHVRLAFVLLPGRSTIERPMSLSAQYQRFVRDELMRESGGRGLVFIDAGAGLSEAARAPSYYPNDGHLTADGHRIVAEQLADFCLPLLAESDSAKAAWNRH